MGICPLKCRDSTGGPAVCGVAASLAPFRAAALRARRLPRTAAPAPAAAGPRRNVPGAARRGLVAARHARARCADRRAKGLGDRAGTPRIVRVGPSSLNGASHPRRAYDAPLTPEPLPTLRA